jgi:hypothetical protein
MASIGNTPNEEKKQRLINVVEKLYDDYANDAELTAFTHLDAEDFIDESETAK